MAQRKPYNPNTKYGRKKLREEAYQRYENMTPQEKADHNTNGCIFTIILVAVILFVVYLIGGEAGVKTYLRR